MVILSENARDYRNFPVKLRVAPWYFNTIPDPDRLLSIPWNTELGFTVYINIYKVYFFRPTNCRTGFKFWRKESFLDHCIIILSLINTR